MIDSTINFTVYYIKVIFSGACGGYLKFILGYGKLRKLKTDIISGIIVSLCLCHTGRWILDTKPASLILIDNPVYISNLETIDIATGFILGIFGVTAFDIFADIIDGYISDRSHK